MPERTSVGDGVLAKHAEVRGADVPFRTLPSPRPSPNGRGEKRWRPRRPVFIKNIVGVGSKPTLLCNHAR
ncbi:MAG TPA: hypothetical protein PKX76_07805, partial [Flexilinea sp.]|nr:hypothetical protein [Flexilinea sp.]